MNQIKSVIFDLDGTLLNTIEDLCDSVNHVLSQNGYPTRILEEVKSFVGHGLKKLMERALPSDATREQVEQAFLCMKEYYTNHCQIKTKAYEGILEVLEQLNREGYQLAIVSNKNQAAVTELNEIYFSKYIHTAIGQSDTVKAKPAPDAIFLAMNELGCEKNEVIYVGDSEVDKETSDNACVDCVLVAWGFRGKEAVEALQPKYVAYTAKDIITIVHGDERI